MFLKITRHAKPVWIVFGGPRLAGNLHGHTRISTFCSFFSVRVNFSTDKGAMDRPRTLVSLAIPDGDSSATRWLHKKPKITYRPVFRSCIVTARGKHPTLRGYISLVSLSDHPCPQRRVLQVSSLRATFSPSLFPNNRTCLPSTRQEPHQIFTIGPPQPRRASSFDI